MLTSEMIRPRLRFSGSTLSVEMVNEQDASLLETAQDLIALLHQHVSRTQEEWEEALEAYEGERVDHVVVRGLAKVLTDAARFTPLATPVPPIVLRQRLFARGPVFGLWLQLLKLLQLLIIEKIKRLPRLNFVS